MDNELDPNMLDPNMQGHIDRAQLVVEAGLGEIVGVKLHLTGDSEAAMALYNGSKPTVRLPGQRGEVQLGTHELVETSDGAEALNG